jgi:polyhydroxybutyrate depolymerase
MPTNAGDPDAPTSTSVDAPPIVAATCAGKSTQPLDATWNLTVNGVARTAKLHVPAAYDPSAGTPLYIGLHGLNSSGDDQAKITHMIAKSDTEGFIAIHPDGTGIPLGWNGGACCNPASSSGIDDVAFISALIDKAESQLCIDTHRVFAGGFSNGAFLAHRLGCELADKVVAIGTVSGVIGTPTCTPSKPVAVFHVHGMSDLVIPYGGGGVNGNISVADSIAKWVANDACTGAPSTTFTHGDATCVNHGSCAASTDVTLCTIDDGGHQWPGGDSSGALNGKVSTDLSATDAMWAFFVAHPR